MLKHKKRKYKPYRLNNPAHGKTCAIVRVGQSLRIQLSSPVSLGYSDNTIWTARSVGYLIKIDNIVTQDDVTYINVVHNEHIPSEWETLSTHFLGNIIIDATEKGGKLHDDVNKHHVTIGIYLECTDDLRKDIITVITNYFDDVNQSTIKIKPYQILELIYQGLEKDEFKAYAFPKSETTNLNTVMGLLYSSIVHTDTNSTNISSTSPYNSFRRNLSNLITTGCERHVFFGFNKLSQESIDFIADDTYHTTKIVLIEKRYSETSMRPVDKIINVNLRIQENFKSKAPATVVQRVTKNPLKREEKSLVLLSPDPSDRIIFERCGTVFTIMVPFPKYLPYRGDSKDNLDSKRWNFKVENLHCNHKTANNLLVTEQDAQTLLFEDKKYFFQTFHVALVKKPAWNNQLQGELILQCDGFDRFSIFIDYKESNVLLQGTLDKVFSGGYQHKENYSPSTPSYTPNYNPSYIANNKSNNRLANTIYDNKTVTKSNYCEVKVSDHAISSASLGTNEKTFAAVVVKTNKSETTTTITSKPKYQSRHLPNRNTHSYYENDVDAYLSKVLGISKSVKKKNNGDKKGIVISNAKSVTGTNISKTISKKINGTIESIENNQCVAVEPKSLNLSLFNPQNLHVINIGNGQNVCITLSLPEGTYEGTTISKQWTVRSDDIDASKFKIWIKTNNLVSINNTIYQKIEFSVIRHQKNHYGDFKVGFLYLQYEDTVRVLTVNLTVSENSPVEDYTYAKNYYEITSHARTWVCRPKLPLIQYKPKYNRHCIRDVWDKKVDISIVNGEEIECIYAISEAEAKSENSISIKIKVSNGEAVILDSSNYRLSDGNYVYRMLARFKVDNNNFEAMLRVYYQNELLPAKIHCTTIDSVKISGPIETAQGKLPNGVSSIEYLFVEEDQQTKYENNSRPIKINNWHHNKTVAVLPTDQLYIQLPNLSEYLGDYLSNQTNKHDFKIDIQEAPLDDNTIKELQKKGMTIDLSERLWFKNHPVIDETTEPWNYQNCFFQSFAEMQPRLDELLSAHRAANPKQMTIPMGKIVFETKIMNKFVVVQTLNLEMFNPKTILANTEGIRQINNPGVDHSMLIINENLTYIFAFDHDDKCDWILSQSPTWFLNTSIKNNQKRKEFIFQIFKTPNTKTQYQQGFLEFIKVYPQDEPTKVTISIRLSGTVTDSD